MGWEGDHFVGRGERRARELRSAGFPMETSAHGGTVGVNGTTSVLSLERCCESRRQGADVTSFAKQFSSAVSELVATGVVGGEANDFSKSDAELFDVVDTRQRAISISHRKIFNNLAFL